MFDEGLGSQNVLLFRTFPTKKPNRRTTDTHKHNPLATGQHPLRPVCVSPAPLPRPLPAPQSLFRCACPKKSLCAQCAPRSSPAHRVPQTHVRAPRGCAPAHAQSRGRTRRRCCVSGAFWRRLRAQGKLWKDVRKSLSVATPERGHASGSGRGTGTRVGPMPAPGLL